MTYNFDADRWRENELDFLKRQYQSGEITEQEFEAASGKLEKRYEEMWARLDGSYQIPRDKK